MGFVYSGFQAFAQVHHLISGKHILHRPIRYYFDFAMDQASGLKTLYVLGRVFEQMDFGEFHVIMNEKNKLTDIRISSDVGFIVSGN
ncbi:hypothetical protein QJS10_CPA03g00407 [Acorus calamus]|uniref:Uncharacterized protein n=1 Tax=Acorus calamus TaxID=4465 RepID=A0AAV9FAH1_ACOCL|nr:hypothetical protein QJS10_CPA03g00407 [Acorus calamus]